MRRQIEAGNQDKLDATWKQIGTRLSPEDTNREDQLRQFGDKLETIWIQFGNKSRTNQKTYRGKLEIRQILVVLFNGV